MFFVLGTGRCGTKAMAAFLNRMPGLTCVHERSPNLVREAHDYLRGRLAREEMVRILRATRGNALSKGRSGESNQKLSFLIDALPEAFPKASCIWLVRNGLDVVASTYFRGWYRSDQARRLVGVQEWADFIIQGHDAGDMSIEEWRGLSVFAKNCWYWGWTNRKIRRDLEANRAKWIMVRLEEIDAQADRIAAFLGVQRPEGLDVPVANVTSGSRTRKPDYWSRPQQEAFRRFCGPLMDELYPGWEARFTRSPWKLRRNWLLSRLNPHWAFQLLRAEVHRRTPPRVWSLAKLVLKRLGCSTF